MQSFVLLWSLCASILARRQGDFSNFVDLPSQELRNLGHNEQDRANHGDCALKLEHGGCITYQDVNKAFSIADKNLDYFELRYRPRGNLSNEEMGNLGTVIHETTRILAKVTTGTPSKKIKYQISIISQIELCASLILPPPYREKTGKI